MSGGGSNEPMPDYMRKEQEAAFAPCATCDNAECGFYETCQNIMITENARRNVRVTRRATDMTTPQDKRGCTKGSKDHPSHIQRSSDASRFDFVCANCGATDADGDSRLATQCPAQTKKQKAPKHD